MSESIATRVGRLISGSLHAAVAAVENAAPDVVMEQAVREIDGAIDEVRAELGKVLAARHLANQRLAEENRRHEEFSAQIEVAVAQKRDDLAEAAIARQMDIEAQLPVLEAALTDGAARQKELEGFVAALQGRRREMEAELQAFRAAQKVTESALAAEGGMAGSGSAERKAERAESAFARVMNQAGVPTVAGGTRDAAKLAELNELSRQNRIRERLEAVKAARK